MTESSPQHHPDALPIGTVLGDFAITGLIGEGGFGIVYLAYEATLDRTVAIKEYLPVTIAARTAELTVAVRSQNNRDAYTSGLQSFLREARMQARFSHPAMLEVYRVWEQNGTAYMAMRFYPGDTLRNLRKSATSSHVFDETAIQRIMMPVFDALVELHSKSVLHRDVSPDNILILPTGQPVLLDFGAARTVVAGAAQSLTTVLKPGYAPIEQYADDGTMVQGPWTDVYGLGAVLYFLAIGTPPPQAVTRLMGDSLRAFEDSASALYSATFIDAVTRALAVRPEGRLQSVDALREALDWRWARASESLPATFIVPTITTPSARTADAEQTVVANPVPNDSERTVVATPSVSQQTATRVPSPPLPTTRGAGVGNLANTTVEQVEHATETSVAVPSSEIPRAALIVSAVLLLVAAVTTIFLFNPGSSTTATSSSGAQSATTTTPAAAVKAPETKAKSTGEVVGAPPTPVQAPNPSLPTDLKSTVPPVSPAVEKALTKPPAAPAAKTATPKAITAEPAESASRSASNPLSTKPTNPARSRTDPVKSRDVGIDAEVASKARGVGRTAPEVCERLLAKLSLGTDDLSSTERKQLSACR